MCKMIFQVGSREALKLEKFVFLKNRIQTTCGKSNKNQPRKYKEVYKKIQTE